MVPFMAFVPYGVAALHEAGAADEFSMGFVAAKVNFDVHRLSAKQYRFGDTRNCADLRAAVARDRCKMA